MQTLSLVGTAAADPAETPPADGETLPPEDPDITISLTHNETGESTSGLSIETAGSESYQAIEGLESADHKEFNANWQSSVLQGATGDFDASLAWNSDGSSLYSESGSLSTAYEVTGTSFSEYDQGFDSSVDGIHASSTEHFTASGAELINYAVATQVSVIDPNDDGSGNSLDPITTVSRSESISVSGNAHTESDVLDLVHWAGSVENTSVAADGSQTIDAEGVILDAAIFTQNIFDETHSSTEQISLEYGSDTGLTVGGNQTSQSEVSGSLDKATDISKITTGADQLSTLGVLTNSFHRTFAGSAANSSAYTLTKAAESDDIIAEYLSSSSSSLEVTDTNAGTFQESAPTTDNNHILAPVSDWNEYRQLSKSEIASIEFDGETWTFVATGSGSLTSNGVYHSTLPDFVAPANTNEAFSYTLNESLAIGTDSEGVSTENHARQFNFTSSPSEPGDGTYQPSAQMEQLAGNLATQFKSSAENQSNTDGTATPPELSPESNGKLRFVMDALNGLVSFFAQIVPEILNEDSSDDASGAQFCATNVARQDGVGHHYFPVSIIDWFARQGMLTEDAELLALGDTTGPTEPSHRYDTYGDVSHAEYNEEVLNKFQEWKKKNRYKLKKVDADGMKRFIDEEIKGADPKSKIGKFNADVAEQRTAYERKYGKGKKNWSSPSKEDLIKNGRRYHGTKQWFAQSAKSRLSDIGENSTRRKPWKPGRTGGLLGAIGFVNGVASTAVGEQVGALGAMANGKHFREAIKALDEGDLDRAKKKLRGSAGPNQLGGGNPDGVYDEINAATTYYAAGKFLADVDAMFEHANTLPDINDRLNEELLEEE